MATQHVESLEPPQRGRFASLEQRLDEEQRRADALALRVTERTTLYAEAEHKLKTELAVLCGWARTLDDRWMELTPEDRRQGVAIIRARADEMAARATRLLEEARAEIGTHVAIPQRLNLSLVLHTAVAQSSAMSHRHTIECHARAAAFVFVDPAGLQQVIGHLLENAVKYSPNGGTITVRARRTGAWVELVVADEGVGIPTGVDLFAPFERGSHDGISGTGLGLYIVAKLVESMGGRVSARRNRVAGSTFVVRLPTAPGRQ
jgi:signal transduction histidine kinase